jgi:hypothetical protein
LLRVKINGRRSYFEWINAGHYVCGGSRGTMNMVATGTVSDLYFGFDLERLLLRLDARGGPFREKLAGVDAVKVRFLNPADYTVQVKHPAEKKPAIDLLHKEKHIAVKDADAAADALLEIAVPFSAMGLKTDDRIQFYVELTRKSQVIERIPNEGVIETTVPSPDYELIMWQA